MSRGRRRVITLVCVVVAGAGLLAACGNQSARPSAQVATYLRRINRIEAGLKSPLATVTASSARLAASSRKPPAAGQRVARQQVVALAGAVRAIRAVGRQLSALPAPAAAHTLRRLLVALAAREAALTTQTSRLIAFLPAYAGRLRPLAPATLRLERVLAVNQAYGASAVQAAYARKAAALRSFATTVGGIASRLRALRPPAVSVPAYRAQLASLRGMRSAAGQLAAALAAGQTSGLSALLARFDHAAAENSTAAVRRAQVAAIRAYDRSVLGVSALTAQAERERTRLAQTLQ